jgi:hypothetical protein
MSKSSMARRRHIPRKSGGGQSGTLKPDAENKKELDQMFRVKTSSGNRSYPTSLDDLLDSLDFPDNDDGK